MRIFLWLLATFIVLGLGVGGYFYPQVTELTIERVTDDLYLFKGFGGNVGVLRTGAGTIVVDTQSFKFQGAAIIEAAEALTHEPVVMIINTHYHFDHTHGNLAFAPDTRVVATARTREHLQTLDGDYWLDDPQLLPNETFEREHVVSLGDKTVRLLHPGRGHTDGDLIVYFVDEQVLHMGDLYFNRLYPNIDLEAGGSVKEWSATLDVALALPVAQIIPGHGELSDRAGLLQFQAFMEELAQVGQDAMVTGKSLEDTIAEAALTLDDGYSSPLEIPFLPSLGREFVIARAWEEATGRIAAP